jgi:hypothetical protein
VVQRPRFLPRGASFTIGGTQTICILRSVRSLCLMQSFECPFGKPIRIEEGCDLLESLHVAVDGGGVEQ